MQSKQLQEKTYPKENCGETVIKIEAHQIHAILPTKSAI
jgi:hypothetical protein